jgi:ATP-dependent Lon protease
VILPKRNEADLEDLPEEVRKEMKFVCVDTVEQVINTALDPVSKNTGKKKTKSKNSAKV